MSLDVDIGHASGRGPRDLNEDFAGAVRAQPGDRRQGLIAAVADGVSGGGLGLEAAQTTVMGLLSDYFATPPGWEPTVALDRLIRAQNAWLADHNRRRRGEGAALTTLTALALQGQTWTLAHVGDTRAWLLRQGEQGPELSLLTQDHALDHPDQRSRLTRAVGLDDGLRVDFAQGEAQVGDTLVLTSDGVHGVLRPTRLAELAAWGTADLAARALVQAALEAGGQDNASALVLRVQGLDPRQLHDEQAWGRTLPVPSPLRVGEALDGLTVTARVADTGVHLLYQVRAADGALGALKTLHPSRASDPQERDMLAHEAWLGRRLTEAEVPGVVRVWPRPAHASAFYLLFDWHQGRTLEQLMAGPGGPPRVADALTAALAWTRTLARLHRLGMVHRDLKPGNLHLGDDGQWRLLDLGVALSGQENAEQRALHAGTPSYMNPEQWEEGGQADAGSDLFALGVTLYQWLTGRLPFGELEPYPRGRHRREPVPASRLRPDVPIWLDRVLAKALAPQARQRFETAEELLLALERGASRPLQPARALPLLQRDPRAALQLALGLSLALNAVLLLWLALWR
ncbi:bifunctional protein-serine/threonine kinase/phosphatase [Ideonella livida]|uniref:Bifunctional protein-serine/threonine kinase/phosphatase n=1 Tax=Ideonella livida TaxID=2707176 RepID=A0A7C9PJF5_9BURK|nr:bifunctional protein-serine/threonine kinase/phosphatase [Ideonella livida]NDY92731.1 bifunctional protein-serine/threonine kinase/phosphatase [Ideonella livida]